MNLDYKKVFETLVNKTIEYLLNNNLKAMILGISGGIDSTVTAAICHEVSKQTGIPLIGRSLPIKNKDNEFNASKLVGEAFCDDFKVVNLFNIYTDVRVFIENSENAIGTPISKGNIQARLRMIYLYNLASIYNGIVFSTDNQTEYQLGFWTLHGDVGDFNPLFGLWKTEVYKLADYILNDTLLEYQASILDREPKDELVNQIDALEASIQLTPTDGLGISNSDLEQIGANSYEEVDDILQTILSYEKPTYEMWDILNKKYDKKVIDKVWYRHMGSTFKRKQLPITINRDQ